MRVISFLVISIVLGITSTVHGLCSSDNLRCQMSRAPKWTITSLSQHVSYHDGPNCFNAALVAAGFSDDIVYVDSLEYAFYLESFCSEQVKAPFATGNLLVYLGVEPHPFADQNEIKIQHAAFSLGGGKLIEKTSNRGRLFGKKEGRELPGVYQVKNLSQSAFATRTSGTKLVKAYKCQSPEQVRKKIASLNEDPLAQQLSSLRQKFSDQIQTMEPAYIQGLNEELKAITQAILSREGTTEGDLFVAALSRSLFGTIESALEERKEDFDQDLVDSINDFSTASSELIDKINTKTSFTKSKPLLLKY